MQKKHSIDNVQLAFVLPTESVDYSTENSELYQKLFDSDTLFSRPVCSRKNGLLFQEDSIAFLKQLPENSIDMIFADPPYNIK